MDSGVGQAPNSAKSNWSSKSIGSRFQHGIFYAMIHLGGRRSAYLLLYLVAAWYAAFSRPSRERLSPYLTHRFGDAGFAHRYRSIVALGKALIDRAVIGILGPKSMKVELNGRERLLEVLGQGKGIIILMSHVGMWQGAMSALGNLETPVNMLMKREEGDVDRHYFEHAGVECPYKVIDPAGYLGGAVEMVNVLNRGEVLCVMGDRVFGDDRNTLRAEFLGESAVFPVSAFKLSSSTGAPVAVLFSRKTGPDSYVIELVDVIAVQKTFGRGLEPLRPFLARYVAALEDYAKKYPYQFYNFIDMWSD